MSQSANLYSKRLALVSLAALLISFAGCKGAPNSHDSKNALASEEETARREKAKPSSETEREKPTRKSKETDEETAQKPEASPGDIQNAFEELLEREAGDRFPKGTRLKSLSLEEGVATLDFSSEFQEMENLGASQESDAQRALLKVAAKFPEVRKLRVRVEGRNFESQSTDWGIPFDVRHSGRSHSKAPVKSE